MIAVKRAEASFGATSIPMQEAGNVKTKHVFMTVMLAEGFIASG